jgi:hypothetical protein
MLTLDVLKTYSVIYKLPIEKKQIRYLLILPCFFIAFFLFSFNCLWTIGNLALDISNLSTGHFAKADGILTTYEVRHDDTYETRIMINGIKYDGGFAYSNALTEGAK